MLAISLFWQLLCATLCRSFSILRPYLLLWTDITHLDRYYTFWQIWVLHITIEMDLCRKYFDMYCWYFEQLFDLRTKLLCYATNANCKCIESASLPFIQLRSGGFCKSAWIKHQRDSSFVVISCSETMSTARPEGSLSLQPMGGGLDWRLWLLANHAGAFSRSTWINHQRGFNFKLSWDVSTAQPSLLPCNQYDQCDQCNQCNQWQEDLAGGCGLLAHWSANLFSQQNGPLHWKGQIKEGPLDDQ